MEKTSSTKSPTHIMTTPRRTFLARAASSIAATTVGYPICAAETGSRTLSKNDRPNIALIGAGYQPDTKRKGRGLAIGAHAKSHGELATICEIDTIAGAYAKEHLGSANTKLVQDYRNVLDDKQIDAVLIATPDHWHTKIAVEAMHAGKDVYCEKPVATCIEEGKLIRETVQKTGRVFQVGTQQRSEYESRFLKAIALVREGRIGKLAQIQIGLGNGWEGGPFETAKPPQSLDWDQWLGPAPMTQYIKERTHRTFRWWFEYAGGQICDWGAHHVDIAQWAIGMDDSGPTSVETTSRLNQPLSDGFPTRSDRYNTPVDFTARCVFPGGVELVIDNSRNGITFEGEQGRFFVNRGTLEGTPVADLKQNPLPEDAIARLYGGKLPTTHMENFFQCIKSRQTPISDIASHHRTLTTCHLANLSIRLGRPMRWDAAKETVIDDDQAAKLMGRDYRKGYEINA